MSSSNNAGRRNLPCGKSSTLFSELRTKGAVDKPLEITLLDAVHFLDGRQLSYAMIGGLAASLQGQSRLTADVDIVIGTNVEDASSLINELDSSPFTPLFEGVDEIVRSAFILPLRHRATGVKVDMSVGLSGFEQQLISRAENKQVAGALVRVASPEDLIVMKFLAARPRDVQDAHGIANVRWKDIDWEYCLRTAKDLGDAVGQDIVTQVKDLRSEYSRDE